MGAREPVAWGAVSYRGCELCNHGKTGKCNEPRVGRDVEFSRARRPEGPCGPDAYFLVFPGLYLPGRQP